mmetsp:Transcript_50446/g.121434  ORF Transcript_50446/g.121434 Transcript_50446/m.121434 type:complete len:389 (-) Transcript_50446:90-1256(-)
MASEGKGEEDAGGGKAVETAVVADHGAEEEEKHQGPPKKLSSRLTITDNPSEVFIVKYSPDGRLIAAGCGDGAVRVYNSTNGRLSYTLNVGRVGGEGLPMTSLRFRPPTAASKTKNVLLAVNADGSAQHWHVTSGKCLHTIKDEENQLYCVDYRRDGAMFATAGKDKTVRLYDEATKSLVTGMSGGVSNVTAGHSNRVFALKFNPSDPNTLLSAGWDNTVQVWDVRAGHAVRCIFGPFVAGEALDLVDNVVLTGSHRTEHALEMWDLRKGDLMERVEWNQSALRGETCMLYTAHFSNDAEHSLIGAGGTTANQAKVFDRMRGNKIIGTIAGLSRGIFSLDFKGSEEVAIAGGDAAVRIFSISGGSPAGSEAPSAATDATETAGGAGKK